MTARISSIPRKARGHRPRPQWIVSTCPGTAERLLNGDRKLLDEGQIARRGDRDIATVHREIAAPQSADDGIPLEPIGFEFDIDRFPKLRGLMKIDTAIRNGFRIERTNASQPLKRIRARRVCAV